MLEVLLEFARTGFVQDDKQFNKLVIYTVGGTPEPIVASILSERPERIIFVSSPEAEGKISDSVLLMLKQTGFKLVPAQYEVVIVPDAQNFESCVQTARGLENEVSRWLQRGSPFTVAVDLTGGTKCMSAALALVASRWTVEFLYVGGGERTKDGTGIVVSGTEHVVRRANPWDSLGYQALEDGTLFFDRGYFGTASLIFEEASHRSTRPEVKREMATLKCLADTYNEWDRFNFDGAKKGLANIRKNFNDLRHAFPVASQQLEQKIEEHEHLLDEMLKQKASDLWVRDLLANARRRAEQKSYDDATARLYRAIEAQGQVALNRQGLTPKPELISLPSHLHDKWRPRADSDGRLRLGLRDLYSLLSDLDDPLGTAFASSELSRPNSPLEMRNNSILAHGFDPIKEVGFQQLWVAVLQLVGVQKEKLVAFPKLRHNK